MRWHARCPRRSAGRDDGLVDDVVPTYMAADVVVLSGDIENTVPEAIDAMEVALTIAGGRVTYRA